jgi:hypothetical protein
MEDERKRVAQSLAEVLPEEAGKIDGGSMPNLDELLSRIDVIKAYCEGAES